MLLDTDILIDLTRGHPPALAWFRCLPAKPPVSGFAALEFTHDRSTVLEVRRALRFLRPFPIVWPTADDMQRALIEYAPRRRSHGLGMIDALIAATTAGRDEPVATFNARHYAAVPGLTTIQPYER